ncbi:MAG: FtsX-like permease family protein [Lachnospiraceae bacterium]|nr:FtsX-like permease family protein [Lachnospiraceae bacterium]
MFFKLALRNVKRQFTNYLIYFMTVAFTVALLFAVNNVLYSNALLLLLNGESDLRTILTWMVALVGLVVAFVLSYATSFMLKLRRREFGTYLTLGMQRGDILRIFLFETLLICGAALGAGLVLGLFCIRGCWHW